MISPPPPDEAQGGGSSKTGRLPSGPVVQLCKSKLHPRVICLPLRPPFLLASSSKVTMGWCEGLQTPFATSLLSSCLRYLNLVGSQVLLGPGPKKEIRISYKRFNSLKRPHRHGEPVTKKMKGSWKWGTIPQFIPLCSELRRANN